VKRALLISTLIGVLALLTSVAYAEEGISSKMLEAITNQIKDTLKVDTAFGTPIEADGMTIIPVASIGFGFGFGAGGSEIGGEEGGGGGGGGMITPIAFLVISEGEAKILPVQPGPLAPLSDIIQGLAPFLMQGMMMQGPGMIEEEY
jgi:uncharacterized spore protein YtfJ